MNAQFLQLRRQLALAGGRPSDAPADAASTRRDDAEYRPGALVESPLRHIDVGDPECWDEDLAFLDGTQHAELIGYVGTMPLLAATVRAAVRIREGRVLRAATSGYRHVVIGRRDALELFGHSAGNVEMLPIDASEETHPIRDVQLARLLVDRARSALELDVARRFRAESDGWLIVDGTLSASTDWATDPKMLGVIKSHAMLPFMGAELEVYLTLPKGCRSSVFSPESRHVTPLYSWALRLHDFAGKDLFHGLVRVEAPATEATLQQVNVISRRLLAERAPLSNDGRADRLLYGIHDVERYLRAQSA